MLSTIATQLVGQLISTNIFLSTLAFVAQAEQAQAPAMAPVIETVQGEQFTDENRWLESLETDSPAVGAGTTLHLNRTRPALAALPYRPSYPPPR